MSTQAKAVCWVIGGLMLIGALFGSDSSPSGTSGGSGSNSYTPVTKSSWCEDHADDPWNGQYDAKMKRYIAECTNK